MGGWPQNKHPVIPGIRRQSPLPLHSHGRQIVGAGQLYYNLAQPRQPLSLSTASSQAESLPSGPDTYPGPPVVAMGTPPVRTRPGQWCFCAGGDLGAAHSGSEQPDHRRWVNLLMFRIPVPRAFLWRKLKVKQTGLKCCVTLELHLTSHCISLENGHHTHLGVSLAYVQ